jgi:hypothetical protein
MAYNPPSYLNQLIQQVQGPSLGQQLYMDRTGAPYMGAGQFNMALPSSASAPSFWQRLVAPRGEAGSTNLFTRFGGGAGAAEPPPISWTPPEGAVLSGEAGAFAPGVAGLAEQAGGAVAANPGLLGTLRAGLPWAGGAGAGGALSTLASRAAPAMGLMIGGKVLAGLGRAAGVPEDFNQAVDAAGTYGGIGYGIAGPIGGLAGGTAGLVKTAATGLFDVAHDNATVDKYSDQLKAFNKAIAKLPKDQREYLNDLAVDAYHQGNRTHDYDAVLKYTKKLTKTAIQQRGFNIQNKQVLDQQTRRQLAIQAAMSEVMNRQAQVMADQGSAAAASIRANPLYQDPRMQPIMEYDAATRDAYGKQMQSAFTGAAYIQPQIDQMNDQLAQYQQLLQQIRAAQTSNAAGGGGSNTISGALKNAGVKK